MRIGTQILAYPKLWMSSNSLRQHILVMSTPSLEKLWRKSGLLSFGETSCEGHHKESRTRASSVWQSRSLDGCHRKSGGCTRGQGEHIHVNWFHPGKQVFADFCLPLPLCRRGRIWPGLF